MQKISQSKKPKALIAALLVLGLISSCASKEISSDAPELPVSDAALLDESERATPVIDDAAVFSDLNAQPADSESVVAGTDATQSDSSSPFYNPIGGESLGRVAYTLYGDRGMFRQLVEQNPELKGVKSLASSQKVFFDFTRVRPMPTFLTKDLLDRYAGELASKVANSNLGKETVTLAPGETLQALSQRLYGTTRYWTEIYLLNQGTISNYDRVPAGVSLSVHQRPMVASTGTTSAPEAPATSAPQEMNEQPLAPIVSETPTQPVAQPVMPRVDSPVAETVAPTTTQPEAVAPAPVDPIPETPSFQDSLAQPAIPAEPAPAQPSSTVAESPAPQAQSALANSANIRRLVYVGLILLIGGLAFYMTRSKKKKGFDMLDVTTNDTTAGRPKLAPKDTQQQDIG